MLISDDVTGGNGVMSGIVVIDNIQKQQSEQDKRNRVQVWWNWI